MYTATSRFDRVYTQRDTDTDNNNRTILDECPVLVELTSYSIRLCRHREESFIYGLRGVEKRTRAA